MKKVYIARVYKFGYDLVAVSTTEDGAKDAIMKEYVRAYKDINGVDPREDIDEIFGGSLYDNTLMDIEVREYTPGVVEWE